MDNFVDYLAAAEPRNSNPRVEGAKALDAFRAINARRTAQSPANRFLAPQQKFGL